MCESAFNTTGERYGMCESPFNTIGERHGDGMVCVNQPISSQVPIPVAARSEAWIRGRVLAGIAGSIPTGVMDVCLFSVLCAVR
jgi:hypothetical protein